MPHSCGGRTYEPDTIYGVSIQARITSFRISSSSKQFSNWQITLVNTQNASVTKIVDSPSIQCAESKHGLRIQFLALVVMIREVWLNA
jgi:hypothetical protein